MHEDIANPTLKSYNSCSLVTQITIRMSEGFLERYHAHRAADAEKSPENKEQGRGTQVTFSFTRHEKPGKTPEGMSADYILPEGLDNAKYRGRKEADAHFLLVTGSKNVKRARQTAKAYMAGVDETYIGELNAAIRKVREVNENNFTEIINKDGSEGTTLHEYGVYAMPDLDPVWDVGKVLKPILAKGKKLVDEGSLPASDLEKWAIGQYMEQPDEVFTEQGVDTPRETAAEMAHRLLSGVRMSGKLYSGLDVKVNNFTHGPKIECLLTQVIRDRKELGHHISVGELRGALSPGESVDFDIRRDDDGNLLPIEALVRGQRYPVDSWQLAQLITEYRERGREAADSIPAASEARATLLYSELDNTAASGRAQALIQRLNAEGVKLADTGLTEGEIKNLEAMGVSSLSTHHEGPAIESRGERETPVVTAYILRHGETTENKLDPNRGLTAQGERQVDEAAERLRQELNPKTDIIQLLDSGNHRANVTVMRLGERLREAGFIFFRPVKLESGTRQPAETGVNISPEPASRPYSRIESARIPDDVKKQLSKPEVHEKLGIPDAIADKRVAAWFLGDWPDEVEKPGEVAARVRTGMENAQKNLPMLAGQLGPDKRIVSISAANASAIEATINEFTGSSVVDRKGEVENCEGFKVDFKLNSQPGFAVWGEKIEQQIE